MIGIYSITHLPSGRSYIGSSKDISARWRMHRNQLSRGIHHSPFLQRAWTKHGAESFAFAVLECVDEDQLLAREQAHIDSAAPAFNCNPIAAKPPSMKGRPKSAAHRAAIGLAHKGRKNPLAVDTSRMRTPAATAKRAATLRGRKLPESTRDKMRAAKVGRPQLESQSRALRMIHESRRGVPRSAETKEKIRAAAIGRTASVETRLKMSLKRKGVPLGPRRKVEAA